MATHILVMYTPLNGEDMENLFNLLQACPDEELLSALAEIEGDESTSTWHQAEDEFKALQLENAQHDLQEALAELELAEYQFQVIARGSRAPSGLREHGQGSEENVSVILKEARKGQQVLASSRKCYRCLCRDFLRISREGTFPEDYLRETH